MYKAVVCFIIFCSFTYYSVLIAQVKAIVVNENNGEAIPYATIKVLHTEGGAYSDGRGFFHLVYGIGDTLQISSIGYKTTWFTITDKQKVTFPLQPAVHQLEQVTVKNRKLYKQHIFGERKAKEEGFYPLFGKGEEFAQLVRLPTDADAFFKIKKVILPIHLTQFSVPLLLHIYSMNETTGMPEHDLLQTKYLIRSKNRKGKTVVIDLEKEDILVNAKGIFVSIQAQMPPVLRDNYTGNVRLPLSHSGDTLTFIRSLLAPGYRWWPFLYMPFKKPGEGTTGDIRPANSMFTIQADEYR